MAKTNKSKSVTESVMKSDTYLSSVPSHKSKVSFFTMMGDRVIVEHLNNGVSTAKSLEQRERLDYVKKRFGGYIYRSDEIKSDPNKAQAIQEKIRKIKRDVKDAKLANELIDALMKTRE